MRSPISFALVCIPLARRTGGGCAPTRCLDPAGLELQRPCRQSVVPAAARHALRLHRSEGRESAPATSSSSRTRRARSRACRASRSRTASTLGGHLEERTTDWYSQDRARQRLVLRRGRPPSSTRTARSRAPRALAGRRRRASRASSCRPTRASGRSGRQEYYKGHAEDHFKVIGLLNTVQLPHGRRATRC